MKKGRGDEKGGKENRDKKGKSVEESGSLQFWTLCSQILWCTCVVSAQTMLDTGQNTCNNKQIYTGDWTITATYTIYFLYSYINTESVGALFVILRQLKGVIFSYNGLGLNYRSELLYSIS